MAGFLSVFFFFKSMTFFTLAFKQILDPRNDFCLGVGGKG